MADVQVTTVNKSGQSATVVCDEGSDFLDDVKKRVKRDELESFDVKPWPPAAKS